MRTPEQREKKRARDRRYRAKNAERVRERQRGHYARIAQLIAYLRQQGFFANVPGSKKEHLRIARTLGILDGIFEKRPPAPGGGQ
jgi:hypothetical protein